MQALRIVLLAVAGAAGGVTALLVGPGGRLETTAPAPSIEIADVLIARTDIPNGNAVATE